MRSSTRMRARATVALVALALPSSPACRPSFEDDPARVTDTRVLAVRIEPPEVRPGDTVVARALVASRSGTVSDAVVEWAACREPKAPSENRSVSQACLDDLLPSAGTGLEVSVAIPGDACALFGPETPPGGLRPRDADATGGYFQPIRLELGGDTAIALERVLCSLPSAPIDVALALRSGYTPNRNPTIRSVTALVRGTPTPMDGIPTDEEVRFEIEWEPGDAEGYLAFDPAEGRIVSRREALRVAWLATGGELEVEQTALGEDDVSTTMDNAWRAPPAPGVVHLWAVLRDSRGGLDFTAWDAVVAER